MKTMNRVFSTLMGLFFIFGAFLGFSQGMFWGGVFVLLLGAALVFGAVSGRWWIRPL